MLTLPRIADATLAEIRDSGVAGTTATAVARRLDVTARALYHYVPDRKELLRLASNRDARRAPSPQQQPDQRRLAGTGRADQRARRKRWPW